MIALLKDSQLEELEEENNRKAKEILKLKEIAEMAQMR